MKIKNRYHYLFSLLITLWSLLSSSALATTLNLTAEFNPDITNPGNRSFVNTTPGSGFCHGYPSRCRYQTGIGLGSMSVSQQMDGDATEEDKQFYLRLYTGFKNGVLTDQDSGHQINVRFRITVFSPRYRATNILNSLQYLGVCGWAGGLGNRNTYQFALNNISSDTFKTCTKRLRPGYKTTATIDALAIGYQLETPDALSVRSGEYRGEITYSLGHNQDIDFGRYATFANGGPELTINIKATVRHAFDLQFPAGSQRVLLAPEGGWSQWINAARVPERLSSQVPFTLSTSGAFQVWMRCEYEQGPDCAIANTQSGESVPLEVALSMPGFKSGGTPVSRYPLTNNINGIKIDSPGRYIINNPSSLEFSVKKTSIDKMVREDNSTWRGGVTMVMDTDF